MAITPLPTPPSRGDNPTTFRTDADAFLGALPAFATEANALAVDVGNDATAAANSATAASDSATAAAASEQVATGAANYQGDYDAGTLYAIGESVSYLGSVFVKKTTAPAGTTPVDGTDWLEVGGGVADFQEFTSSGTWTKPDGAAFVYVEAIGGGGGGSNRTLGDCGGGSGGEFIGQILLASSVSTTETVSVGAGGLGGADLVNSAGSVGGASSFGAHVIAKGGNGGNTSAQMTRIPRGLTNVSDVTAAQAFLAIVSPQSGFGASTIGTRNGGNTIYGGAGGAGASGGAGGDGGVSEFGGNGGIGNGQSNTRAGDGEAPGGGGGASTNNGGGGDGGDGRVRVWSW